jgi:hypothetical protein
MRPCSSLKATEKNKKPYFLCHSSSADVHGRDNFETKRKWNYNIKAYL